MHTTDVIEHANITVRDIDATLHFLQTALPTWRVRGGGTMDWFGKPIRWAHIGTDHSYLALQSGGVGDELDWTSHQVGTKHIGIVVASVDAVVDRLVSAGHALDHWGGSDAFRKSAYFVCPGSVQFEFVAYRSDSVTERNRYSE